MQRQGDRPRNSFPGLGNDAVRTGSDTFHAVVRHGVPEKCFPQLAQCWVTSSLNIGTTACHDQQFSLTLEGAVGDLDFPVGRFHLFPAIVRSLAIAPLAATWAFTIMSVSGQVKDSCVGDSTMSFSNRTEVILLTEKGSPRYILYHLDIISAKMFFSPATCSLAYEYLERCKAPSKPYCWTTQVRFEGEGTERKQKITAISREQDVFFCKKEIIYLLESPEDWKCLLLKHGPIPLQVLESSPEKNQQRLRLSLLRFVQVLPQVLSHKCSPVRLRRICVHAQCLICVSMRQSDRFLKLVVQRAERFPMIVSPRQARYRNSLDRILPPGARNTVRMFQHLTNEGKTLRKQRNGSGRPLHKVDILKELSW